MIPLGHKHRPILASISRATHVAPFVEQLPWHRDSSCFENKILTMPSPLTLHRGGIADMSLITPLSFFVDRSDLSAHFGNPAFGSITFITDFGL